MANKADQRNNPKNNASPLFKRLTKLFSGPIVNFRAQKPSRERKYQLDKYASRFNSLQGLSYKKNVYNPFDSLRSGNMAIQSRAERYVDFEQMEFYPELACLVGDTEVATLEGLISIKELAEKYPNGESFEVWAWDNKLCQYTIGNAHHARETGVKEILEITLDNDEVLRCTPDHRILMRDGTYKEAGKINEGESLMPFDYNKNGSGYMRVRTKNFGKYKQVHRYIFEDIFEQNIGNNNIHHINENKMDNRLSNLQILSPAEHLKIHGFSRTTNDKRSKTNIENWANLSDIQKDKILSGVRSWQMSDEGKKFMSEHTSAINKKRWATDVNYVNKMTKIFSDKAKQLWEDSEWKRWKKEEHSRTMILKYINDPEFKEKTKHFAEKNGRYINVITTESILNSGLEYNSLVELARNFNFGDRNFSHENYKVQFINRRLREAGFKGWADYKKRYSYNNHKVKKITLLNQKEKVYDLTVDHFENFCLGNGAIVSNSALDVYADEMTTFTEVSKVLKIDCHNEEIKNILDTLFYKTLNIESNLFNWARTMCKYGDFFLYLDTDEVLGVKSAIGLPSQEIERLEGEDQTNPNYIQFQWNAGGLTFENWQIAHFRVLGNDKYTPYGTSVLDPARRIWRQLILVEDAMMAARVIRAPDRKVFEIDVSGIPPEDVEQYMQRVITQMKRHQVVDDTTGQVDLRYNPLSVEEDYYLPVRAGSVSKITPLTGQKGIDAIDDIKYLKDKLFAAIKIPKAYLSQSDSDKEDKSTLAQKDIRFARTVQRLQRAMLSELEKVGIVHLYTLGFRGDDLISFKLSLNNPSRIAQMQELEALKTKIDVASSANGLGFFSRQYISKNIFGFSDEDFEKIERQRFYDKRIDAALEASAQDTPTAGDMSGLGGPSLPTEPTAGVEGALGAGPGTLGAEMAPPAAGAEEGGKPGEAGEAGAAGGKPEEAPTLLATPPPEAPAKRDSVVKRDKEDKPVKIEYADGSYLTLGANGKKYKPVTVDKREDRGPVSRHIKSLWGGTYGNNSKRNVFGFGYVTSDRLAKGIAESIDTNYNKSAENQLNKLDRDLETIMEE